jgi:hypothetical protein
MDVKRLAFQKDVVTAFTSKFNIKMFYIFPQNCNYVIRENQGLRVLQDSVMRTVFGTDG